MFKLSSWFGYVLSYFHFETTSKYDNELEKATMKYITDFEHKEV